MEALGVAKEVLSPLVGKLGTMLAEEAVLLEGVHDEVRFIKDELESMSEFLRNAEERPGSGGEALSWVDQVRRLAYDAEDCVDEYALHLHPIDGLSIFHRLKTLKARHQIATKIQTIKTRARDVSERRSRYFLPGPNPGPAPSTYGTTAHTLPDPRLPALFVEEAELVGIEGPRNKLLDWLMAKDEPQLMAISVLGMGGLGKTTLVRRVYEDQRVSGGGGHFQCRAWITVSQSFEIKGILKSMARQVFSSTTKEETEQMEKKMEIADEAQHIEILRDHLKDKRYVVVLDDVWTVPDWEIIVSASPANTLGSRIMVTTRIESVANVAARRFPPSLVAPHVYNLQPLTHEQSWGLFRRRVFSSPFYLCPPDLKEVSEGFLRKCGGLPLAIVTICGLLACSFNRSHREWQNLHDRLGDELETNPALGPMKTILNFSYNDLPPQLKRCFLYLSVFPEDYSIDRKRLVRLWVAQGFVTRPTCRGMAAPAEEEEASSDRCFNELISRSLIQPWEFGGSGKVKSCRVHDVIRELILSKSMKEMYISVLGVEDYISHLSVHGSVLDSKNMSLDYIRSLTMFGDGWPSLISPRMRLLRVLDLQDCTTVGDEHLKIICKFLGLKYLRMVCRSLQKLPKCIGNLQNLETLYIECNKFENIEVPTTIVKLQKLRILTIVYIGGLVYRARFKFGVGMTILPRGGVGKLKALQKLKYVDAEGSGKGAMRGLAELTQLRKLGVTRLTEETGMEFCTVLEKLNSCLRSLSVATADGFHGYKFLDSLSSPPLHLQSLALGGKLRALPRWVDSLRDVAKITLSGPVIKEELLLPLQTLPSLINLHLVAWGDEGMRLCFHRDGFRSLKVVSLTTPFRMTTISLVFKEGAMPNLEKLRIAGNLEVLGMKYLASLKEIELYKSSQKDVRIMEDIVKDHPNNPRVRIITI